MSRFWTLLGFSTVIIFVLNVLIRRSSTSIPSSFPTSFGQGVSYTEDIEKSPNEPLDVTSVPFAEYAAPSKATLKQWSSTAEDTTVSPTSETVSKVAPPVDTDISTASVTGAALPNASNASNADLDADDDTSSSHKVGKSLNIAITETNGWHDEVLAALVHSIGSQEEATLHIYQKNQRYGITEVMAAFELPKPVPAYQSPSVFDENKDTVDLDIVVLTTCETDLLHLATRMKALLAGKKTYLFCVVHHADRWRGEEIVSAILPWIEAEMVDFITLSPHTASYLKENAVPAWESSANITIRSFAPLFPVTISNATSTAIKGVTADAEDIKPPADELAFAIQGNVTPDRRDFPTVFGHLQKILEDPSTSPTAPNSTKSANANAKITLHLIGDGNPRPIVPAQLTGHVFFDQGLSYSDYFSTLSRAFATLPAFANNEYLDRKASSTVPAALIGGSPLVATQQILDAYSYLPKDSVYVQKEGQNEMDVVTQVLKLDDEQRRRKSQNVRDTCKKIIKENAETFGKWIREVRTKMDT